MDLFSRGLQEYGVPDEALQNLGQHVYEQSPMQSTLHTNNGSLTTHYRRLQYYRKEFNLVEPVQINLGQDDTGKQQHFHYVPILQSLKALLSNEGVRHQVLHPIPAIENMLRDIGDGHVIKSIILFFSLNVALILLS